MKASIPNEKSKPRVAAVVAEQMIRLLALLYLCIGILKLHSLFFPQTVMAQYLRMPNPIFVYLTNHTILMLAAVAEIAVGVYASVSRDSLLWRSAAMLWLTAAAFAYKLCLAAVHYTGPCGCLLGINRFLPIDRKSVV